MAAWPPQGGLLTKGADMVFAFAIPAHMHITMNTIVSDYLPKVARGATVLPCVHITPHALPIASTRLMRARAHVPICIMYGIPVYDK